MAREPSKVFEPTFVEIHPTLGPRIVSRVPTVRESQGILSESGKVRKGQGKVREF